MQFITNVKSCYSLQKSVITIDQLIEYAKSQDIKAIVLCDNNMYATKEFYDKCNQNSIKPIIGLEVKVQINNDEFTSFNVIAKNTNGYKDLMKLSSEQEKNDHIDLNLLKNNANLKVIIPYNGIVKEKISSNKESELKSILHNINDLYLGYYDGISDQEISFAQKNGIRIIEFNPAIGIKNSDVKALNNFKQQKLNDKNSSFDTEIYNENYSIESKNETLYYQDTLGIIQECSFEINQTAHLPKYNNLSNEESKALITKLICNGLNEMNIPLENKQKYIDRIKKELSVINEMGFIDYFLIVQDYVNFAREKGILVGPGRGSAAGSLIARALKITEIDPLEYDLLFERFLNKDRISMPDIDIDFEAERAGEVEQYLVAKYGIDHVGKIITFNNYGIKLSLREYAKGLGIPAKELTNFSKIIDDYEKNNKPKKLILKEIYKNSIQMQNAINKYPKLKESIDTVDVIANTIKSTSIHPAGIVISDTNINEHVPLSYPNTSKIPVSQYSKNYIESTGLIKMDELKLRDLNLLKDVLNNIKSTNNIELQLKDIPLDDKKTYEMFKNKETTGVFQFGTPDMKKQLSVLKCNNFDDLIALVSLNRPGPKEYIPVYAKRKEGKEKIEYPVPELEPILKNTFGIFIYQEQLMKTATDIAGFTMGEADNLRAAISKKNIDKMNVLKPKFIKGCIEKSHLTEEKSNEIFDIIEKFADYGFNKSHAVAYAKLAYDIAYLKANYTIEYYAALLNQKSTLDLLGNECKRMKIGFINPSINESENKFKVKNGKILCSLSAIKKLNQPLCNEIIEERNKNGNYKSIIDFMERVHVTALEFNALNDSGCFDCFGYSRTTLHENYEQICSFINNKDLFICDENSFVLRKTPDDFYKISNNELNALGINISKDPVTFIKNQYNRNSINDISKLKDDDNNIIAQVHFVKEIVTKKDDRMCNLNVHDETGSIKITVFPSQYEQFKKDLKNNEILKINGKLKRDEKYGNQIIANTIENVTSKLNISEQKQNIIMNEIEQEKPISVNNKKTINEKEPPLINF